MPVKITPFALSVTLASQMILVDKLRHSTLAEPPHTHDEPQIPEQRFVVTAPGVSGSNVVSSTHSIDAYIDDGSLVQKEKL